jgi:predicted solute-binding protein
MYGKGKIQIKRNDTRRNLKGVLDGTLDFSMISLVDYFKNKDKLKLIDGPTITGKNHSNSNLLISKGAEPLPGMRVSITSETETTAFYLKMILDEMFPNSYLIRSKLSKPEDLLKEEDFALVIGNSALSVYNSNLKIIFDITHMISKLFNTYSIYAVTVALREFTNENEVSFLKDIPSWFIYRSLNEISMDHNVSRDLLRQYYSSLTYTFNDLIKDEISNLNKTYDRIKETIFLKKIEDRTMGR